ncbi:MAG: M12 family metallo-peptidase [Saprospiraceae bacterium]
MKRLLPLLLFLAVNFLFGQQTTPSWHTRAETSIVVSSTATLHEYAYDYRLVSLESDALRDELLATHKQQRQIEIPLPDGNDIRVTLVPVGVMHPDLAARYPGIQTYTILPEGKRILGGRAGWTYQGFHATLRTTDGTYYVDPYILNDTRYYVTYRLEDNLRPDLQAGFECGVTGHNGLDMDEIYTPASVLQQQDKTTMGVSIQQRKYRLAMACTGEFSDFHGGTVESAMSAIVTIVNRVNEVFGREFAVQLELIANNDLLVFLDKDTDPYVNETDEMLNDNPGVLNQQVGNAAYDIGHVISTGPSVGQGVASLAGVCRAQTKGRATSTRQSPQGDPFVINILCHEMGHQFSATHIMSGCQNVEPATSVEPGGGTTIMGYAGICPSGYNIQTNSDDYYNSTSLQQMINYTRMDDGDLCAQHIDEGNTAPEVSHEYTNGFYIPVRTPFELSASATDMENDDLTYCWEQRDANSGYPYNDNDYGPFLGQPVGNSPIFRTFDPVVSPTRIFPAINKIVNNVTNAVDELLPTYSRTLTFRCTVRDNHPTSGGVDWREVQFFATQDAGPFLVTHPNTATDVWYVGDYTEVTWDVANTQLSPVNCQRVNIKLSTDGGFTYPITLLENTPNDGSAFVTVPDEVGNTVRIRVEAADNIFFDISNRNFAIQPAQEPGYILEYGPVYQEICVPDNQVVVDFPTGAVLDYSTTINFAITSELPEGVEANFAAPSITTGDVNSLSLDFSGSMFDGLLEVEVQAITADMDTTYRVFEVEVYNNNFSNFALLTPEAGTTGIVLSADFSTALPNAQRYDFQLATDPAFNNLIDEVSNLDEVSYTPTVLLDANTLSSGG